MNPIEKLFDKIRPQFEKGGRLHSLHYAFDAFDSLLFVRGRTPGTGTHIKDGIDLKRTMFVVVLALIPCLLFGIWNVGHQHYAALGEFAELGSGFWTKVFYGAGKVLPMVVVAYAAGLGVEFTFAVIRKHPVNEGFLVTGILIPLIMPPMIPLWMIALATIFAVVIGKEAFGGTGMNILNIALLARVFIFFAYPTYISGELVWVAGDPARFVDGFSGATPLAVAFVDGQEGLAAVSHFTYDLKHIVLGIIPGSVGETSAIAVGLGALVLLVTGIGSWRIMLSTVLGTLAIGILFSVVNITPFEGVRPVDHLFMGSMLFATVFMATDPVTAAQTNTGKFIYGGLIGVFGMVIRVLNPAYPEGWMLAILLMNVFAPTIDHFVLQAHIKRRVSRALE